MTAPQIYNETTKTLPAAERLQLATLILNDIPPQLVSNLGGDWTSQEQQRLTKDTLRYAAASYPEDEALV